MDLQRGKFDEGRPIAGNVTLPMRIGAFPLNIYDAYCTCRVWSGESSFRAAARVVVVHHKPGGCRFRI